MSIQNQLTMRQTLEQILDSIDTGEILGMVVRGDCTTLTDAVDEICQYRIPRGIISDSNSYAYPQTGDTETAQAVIDYIRGRVEGADREEFCEED